MADDNTSNAFKTIVQYSVEHGFRQADCAEWADGTEESAWFAALGVEHYAEDEDGPEHYGQLHVHLQAENSTGAWYAVVKYETSGRLEYIAVKTAADLIALHVALAPLVQMKWANAVMPVVMQAIQRAFEAWHGHRPDDHCGECDRRETYYERERARVKALREQAQREKEKSEKETAQ